MVIFIKEKSKQGFFIYNHNKQNEQYYYNQQQGLQSKIHIKSLIHLWTKKTFEVKTLLDNYVFFYSLILANNPDNILEWNDFIDALDNDPNIFKQINDLVNSSMKIEDLIGGDETDKDGQKKN